MQDWSAKLGRNVRRLRQQRDLTQEQLAFDAEIDLTYVGGIERGKRNPSLLVMARIADALSVRRTAGMRPPAFVALQASGRAAPY
jgi:transcriptional regulator with XRE-family HTH domain